MNKGKILWTASFGLLAALSFASITVPRGTDVLLTFDQNVNSRHMHAGDTIKLHVTNDVVVDGRTVLHAGTPVIASVDSVKKNERFGINASMKLDFHDARGIPLMARSTGKVVGGTRSDEAAGAAAAGAIVLGPIGLLGSYFVVGRPVKIHPGEKVETQVAQDTVIQ